MTLHLACDSHIHILESHATVVQYRQIQSQLGLARVVVVQPRAYGTDNRITLEAIAKLGIENARGIAVVHPTVGNYELAKLHSGGIRGLRMSLYTPENAAVSFEMLEPLARIAYGLGWHVQLHWTADQIVQYAPKLFKLPTTFVFYHLARLPVREGAKGIRHAAFSVVCELMQQGRAWVKL
jgi:D-galactarolactone isomerase